MSLPEGLIAHENVQQWREANKDSFQPPICNKLLHRKQLSVMFVGGPNTRTDFHIEEGSEFFFQMQGNMELPTVQRGHRKLVRIREGEMFLLPSRVPHSPQRPEENSFGLVVERARDASEFDALRWYVDFQTCDQVLWEKYFHCYDLGRDLVPVVKEFKASHEFATNTPMKPLADHERLLKQDTETEVPDPINFEAFLAQHKDELASGASISVFGPTHPDKEITVLVVGGPSKQTDVTTSPRMETWLYQHKGSAVVSVVGASGSVELKEGCCVVVGAGVSYSVERVAGSIGLVVTQDPEGNKRKA